MEALDPHIIHSQLRPEAPRVSYFEVVTSTNEVLKDILRQSFSPHVVLASQQTRGRGRRGRRWLSPKDAGLYLSYGHITHRPVDTLGPLSLVMAISVATVLPDVVHIKWPNDLMVKQDKQWAKVGGCLVEIMTNPGTSTAAILGVGLNLHMAQHLTNQPADTPTQLWADLPLLVDPSTLVAQLVNQLHLDLAVLEQDGFGPFQARWETLHILRNQPVQVTHSPTERFRGTAGDINEYGQLAVTTDDGLVWVSAADVSIRLTHPS